MENKIRAALLDFDGTLVTKDILDLLCSAVGKEEESKMINEAFHRGELPGLSALVTRINFLIGMTQSQIDDVLKPNSYLMPGVRELMSYFKDHNIITILASGNITPFLKYYQDLLGIDYIVGSVPTMDGEAIAGIDESAFSSKSFKIDGINSILSTYKFKKENIIAMGDSPSDKGIFGLSGYSIAINPKGDVANFADRVVRDDLAKVIPLLEEYEAVS
jgi:HAD superfamily phosphoserine phosphatase-like hydrolase